MKIKIHVNQIGYFSNLPKIAIITAGRDMAFTVEERHSGKIVFRGTLSMPIWSENAGETVRQADFTSLTGDREEEYMIACGHARSYPFCIHNQPYDHLLEQALLNFSRSHCGSWQSCQKDTVYSRQKCHQNVLPLLENHERLYDVSGGWHTGYNYDRSVILHASAIAFLLYGGILFPDGALQNVLLEECRSALLWLMKMQDDDGGVFHMVAAAETAGSVFVPSDPPVNSISAFGISCSLPENDTETYYIYPKSIAATLYCCGVFALAARVYRNIDASFSRALQTRTRQAYRWLEEAKDKNIPDIPAEDTLAKKELTSAALAGASVWVQMECYQLFGQNVYLQRFLQDIHSVDITSFTWQNIGGFALLSYLTGPLQTDPLLRSECMEILLGHAELLYTFTRRNAYRNSLQADSFQRESNLKLVSHAFCLMLADYFSDEPERQQGVSPSPPFSSRNRHYREAALEQLHYILGRNPMGISYITGFGGNSVKYPCHWPSMAGGMSASVKAPNVFSVRSPWPGLLVNGPNTLREDDFTRWMFPRELPPARCYVDRDCCPELNGVNLAANAALTVILTYFHRQ